MNKTKRPIEFIKKNIGNSLKPTKLSESSKQFLNKIADQILLGQQAWISKTKYDEHVLEKDEFPKGVDFNYIDPEIREEIVKFSKIGKKYSFFIKERRIHIYTVYPLVNPLVNSANQRAIYKLLDESVKKMYIWLYAASYFAPSECSREITIYLYLTDEKKTLPEIDGEPISSINANTAFTFACSREPNNIYIYRKEEWFKVFIHESFHALGLDFAKMPDHIANEEVFKIFNITCDLRFYEAYTETWAEIIHVLFICMENQGKIIEFLLNDERMFSLFQNANILNHQKMKYRQLQMKNNYKEETHVFSYYILKSIMMFFHDDFIRWTIENNGHSIAFKQNPENIKSLVSFIRDRYNNPEYLTAINDFEEWFSKSNKKTNEMKTLRMSISEF
jgi:hypothetical protein